MADDNISTAEEGSDVRPGITFFKARGLKGRVKEVDIKSFDDILAYTETYEDLLFFKHLIQYYMNRIKKTNVVEKDIEMFTDILDKVNKKIKKAITLSLHNQHYEILGSSDII